MSADNLQQLEEGQYVYDSENNEVFQVEEMDVQYLCEEFPSGRVSLSGSVGTHKRDAMDVDHGLNYGDLFVVDEEVIENAEEILLDFAESEVSNYANRIGSSHQYEGIPNVNTVRDLQVAAFMRSQNNGIHG